MIDLSRVFRDSRGVCTNIISRGNVVDTIRQVVKSDVWVATKEGAYLGSFYLQLPEEQDFNTPIYIIPNIDMKYFAILFEIIRVDYKNNFELLVNSTFEKEILPYMEDAHFVLRSRDERGYTQFYYVNRVTA